MRQVLLFVVLCLCSSCARDGNHRSLTAPEPLLSKGGGIQGRWTGPLTMEMRDTRSGARCELREEVSLTIRDVEPLRSGGRLTADVKGFRLPSPCDNFPRDTGR